MVGIKSERFGALPECNTLNVIALYVAAFYFDMRGAHFLSNGTEFLEVHEFAEGLYKKAEEVYDDFIEMAISYDEMILPMFCYPDDWEFIYGKNYFNIPSIINAMRDRVQFLFDCMESIDKDIYSSFVYSKVDSVLEWLDKQNYKLMQMSGNVPRTGMFAQ